MTTPPFDPYLDADNPYITEIPERFVAPEHSVFDYDFEDTFGPWEEEIFDPDF